MGETTMTGWTMRGAAFAAALGVAGAGAAQAATLTVTDTGVRGASGSTTVSVPLFDGSLGALTEVAWTLILDWSATVEFTNPTTASICLLGCREVALGLLFASNPVGVGLSGLSGVVEPVAPVFLSRDGILGGQLIAPGETESVTVPVRSFSFAGSTGNPPGLGAGDLSDWLAPGDAGFELFAIPYVDIFGDERLVTTRFTENLTATLSVTYTYDPVTGGGGGPDDPVDPVPVVPLPAGLPLMLGGLAALAVVRRRRGA